MAAKKGATLAQLVLRWTIEQPAITIALAGARNEKQSVENAGARMLGLLHDEVVFINNELAKLNLVGDKVVAA
jgi:aryl-alcohol dehydrogenase-like predicted oxidoreductase